MKYKKKIKRYAYCEDRKSRGHNDLLKYEDECIIEIKHKRRIKRYDTDKTNTKKFNKHNQKPYT